MVPVIVKLCESPAELGFTYDELKIGSTSNQVGHCRFDIRQHLVNVI